LTRPRSSRRRTLGTALFAVLLCACAAPARSMASSLFLIEGGGWGNGVGMSQWGAEGYALHGWSYKQILAHYYPQTTLGAAPDQPVRVLIADRRPQVTIGSAAPFLLVDARGRKVHVRTSLLPLSPRLRLGGKRLVPPLSIEPGAQPLTLGGRGYRGAFTILRKNGALSVVNTLSLERYLRSVVRSEMPGQWAAQAYAAQAVAARSFALATLKPGSPFDLYDDNRSQMYGGIATESPATNDAVGATAGQVLTYDGQVITAYYDSNSGGRTAAVQDVFAGMHPVPYLVSVSDPYDSLSPNHRWRVALLAAGLSSRFGMTVDDVRVTHGDSGVATSVLLVGPHRQKKLSATEFAQALGLRSVRFSVSVASLADVSARVPTASPLQLHGFLRQIGGVVLQQRLQDGSWQQVRRVQARADGRFQVVVRPRFSTAYRLAVDQVAGPALAVSVSR
jgi:stage II sporulation protein D